MYGNVIKNIYKRKMCNAKESFVESRHFSKIWRRQKYTTIFSSFISASHSSFALIPPLFHPRMCTVI